MAGRYHINRAALRELLVGQTGIVVRHVRDICENTRTEGARIAPRDTGRLASSLSTTLNVEGTIVRGRVGTLLDYARYVSMGTGIYGPKHKRIRPVSKKALRFRAGRIIGPLPRGQVELAPERRAWVFAKSVRGVPPRPFLVIAFKRVSPYPVREL